MFEPLSHEQELPCVFGDQNKRKHVVFSHSFPKSFQKFYIMGKFKFFTDVEKNFVRIHSDEVKSYTVDLFVGVKFEFWYQKFVNFVEFIKIFLFWGERVVGLNEK